jgi:hypothetical protein
LNCLGFRLAAAPAYRGRRKPLALARASEPAQRFSMRRTRIRGLLVIVTDV